MSINVFYMVWNPEGPTNPQHHHRTEAGAQTEAERLAATHPGHSFYVCQVIGVARRVDVIYTKLDDIPF